MTFCVEIDQTHHVLHFVCKSTITIVATMSNIHVIFGKYNVYAVSNYVTSSTQKNKMKQNGNDGNSLVNLSPKKKKLCNRKVGFMISTQLLSFALPSLFTEFRHSGTCVGNIVHVS
jgi:hypothetical protein